MFVPTNTPVQNTSSSLPLPQGKVPFFVSSGQKSGPQFRNGFLDPYDPVPGQTQSIAIHISGQAPITDVSAILKSDTKSETYPLRLFDGTDKDGQWEGKWTVADTHNSIYRLILNATDSTGFTNLIDITLR
jgi:hypothetical protein